MSNKPATKGKNPKASRADAKTALSSTWFGLTILRATALLAMLTAYAGAFGVLFGKFGADSKALRQSNPVLFWCLILLPLVFIFGFSVGPEYWKRLQAARRKKRALAVDPTPITSYFRLDPYVSDKPEDFARADGAHETVLRSILKSKGTILFLSGLSGTGKTSLLEGFVVPKLQSESWVVESVRSFDDPLAGVEGALGKPRAKGGSLLVVFDQFEEFVILRERTKTQSHDAFLERIQDLKQKADPAVRLLFVVRTDYLNAVVQLGIDDLISRQNWAEIDPFRRAAARAFLSGSPLHPDEALVDQMLDGAEAIEEARGLYRAITLNLLGLAAQNFDTQVTIAPTKLIQDYLKSAMLQVGISEISPKVVSAMVSEAGTKSPRSISELATEAAISEPEVRLCLALLFSKGLVRPLDKSRTLWEISHDFVAKQLGIIVGQLRPSPWPRVALWATPFLFAAVLAIGVYAVPTYVRQQADRELRDWGASISGDVDGGIEVQLPELPGDNDTLAGIIPLAQRLGATALDVSDSEVTSFAPVSQFKELRTLDASDIEVSDLRPLSRLPNLASLDVSRTNVVRLDPLQNMMSLRDLTITQSDITSIAPLKGLNKLETLLLSGSQSITDFTPLAGMVGLKSLYLTNTRFSNPAILQNLAKLDILDLGGTQVTDFSGLCALKKLRVLTVSNDHIARFTDFACLRDSLGSITTRKIANVDVATIAQLVNLYNLDLSQSGVTDVTPLKTLTKLKTVNLAQTAVAEISAFQDLPQLTTVTLLGTAVKKDDPVVAKLVARGVKVDIVADVKQEKSKKGR